MSDSLSFAEIEGQHVELLPARTVLSLMFTAPHGGNGGAGYGGIGINAGNGALNGAYQSNVAGGGFGGYGGAAHGGIGGNGGDGHGGFGINFGNVSSGPGSVGISSAGNGVGGDGGRG